MKHFDKNNTNDKVIIDKFAIPLVQTASTPIPNDPNAKIIETPTDPDPDPEIPSLDPATLNRDNNEDLGQGEKSPIKFKPLPKLKKELESKNKSDPFSGTVNSKVLTRQEILPPKPAILNRDNNEDLGQREESPIKFKPFLKLKRDIESKNISELFSDTVDPYILNPNNRRHQSQLKEFSRPKGKVPITEKKMGGKFTRNKSSKKTKRRRK